MTKSIDTEYYARRIAQERAQADRTGSPVARRVHDELATRYAQMLGPRSVA